MISDLCAQWEDFDDVDNSFLLPAAKEELTLIVKRYHGKVCMSKRNLQQNTNHIKSHSKTSSDI